MTDPEFIDEVAKQKTYPVEPECVELVCLLPEERDRLIGIARRKEELEKLTDKSVLDSVDDSIYRGKLEAKVKRYEKALEHYAKPRGWTKDAYGDWKSYLDESIIAIEALEDKE